MGNQGSKHPSLWLISSHPGRKWSHPGWMSSLPDDCPLSQLSIPGTNASMTYSTTAPGSIWIRCQALDMAKQLDLGIRYFDLHFRHLKNRLLLYDRSFYLGCSLEAVLRDIDHFLEKNGKETVIVSIRETDLDYTREGNTEKFGETVERYLYQVPGNRVFRRKHVPSLCEVRGKIIVLPQFRSSKPSVNWKKIDMFTNRNPESLDSMWSEITEHVQRGQNDGKGQLFVTYTNCACGAMAPRETARIINARLHRLVQDTHGKVGVLAMDYPGPQLIKDIIARNIKD